MVNKNISFSHQTLDLYFQSAVLLHKNKDKTNGFVTFVNIYGSKPLIGNKLFDFICKFFTKCVKTCVRF